MVAQAMGDADVGDDSADATIDALLAELQAETDSSVGATFDDGTDPTEPDMVLSDPGMSADDGQAALDKEEKKEVKELADKEAVDFARSYDETKWWRE